MTEDEVKAWLETPIGAKLMANIHEDLEVIMEARAKGAFDRPGEKDGDYLRGIARGREEQLTKMEGIEALTDYILWESEDE